MDDTFEWIDLFSGVATSRDSKGYTMQLPRVCLTMYLVHNITLGDTIIPLVRS